MPSFPAEEKKRAYRGAGYEIFQLDGILNPLFKKGTKILIEKIPVGDRVDFYWGAGWGIRERFREDKTRALDWIARLPGPARPEARSDLEVFERWYGIE